MDCIVLDDEDVVCLTMEPITTDHQNKPKGFEKRLIRLVRPHRIIYDNKHKSFANVDKKEIIWQEIANKLKSDVETCKSTWIELRYKYQRYVRRLRKDFINNTKKMRKRPPKNLECELIYLFRFIDNRKTCPIPYDIVVPAPEEEEELPQPINIDDDLILIEQPVELIVIDEDDDNRNGEKPFKVTKDMITMVEEIKKYPELYDSTQTDFKDYSRKSYIWNAIAVQLGDKATKLMKCWILMTTRYEWEISTVIQNTDVASYQTDLQKAMEFFEPFILANPETVYKHSFYLKQAWYEPIDYFKEIYNLILRMKKIADVVYITDSLLTNSEKSKQFFDMWAEVAKMKGSTTGQCESTWLIMRLFYWELMNMRQHNYQLTDKWYFETVITELYDLARQSRVAHVTKFNKQQKAPDVTVTKRRFQYLNKLSNNSSATMNNGGVRNITQTVPLGQSSLPQFEQSPLPKITSAISLAPQVLSAAPVNGGSLQIRPLGIHSNVVMSPPQQQQPQQQLPPPPQQQLQPPRKSFPPHTTIQLPITMTGPTQLSALNMPTVANTKNTPLTFKSNVKPIIINAAVNTSSSDITITPKTTIAAQVAPAPMVCINTSIKSPSVSTLNQGLSQTPATPNTPIASAITTEAAAMTTSPTPLPKISGAISLLNPNEILIELIASQTGNHLVVHGPPLSEKYLLPMSTVAKFIREVLAIPLLHNKRHNQPTLINGYWDHMSKKFNLPAHICRACWNFLVENFNHFPQIAPLKELMKPFSTTLNVWTESFDLFKVFDQHAVSNGWLGYMSRLPEIVECIGTYPVLYKEIAKNAKTSTSDMEEVCVWRTISLRFPNINDISTIWVAFKNVFCQYMSDIEFGIDNKWHINWWRVLARLKFLVETRYSTNEPYYYIVSNKMMEEIERCAMVEMKNRYGKEVDKKGDIIIDQRPTTSKAVPVPDLKIPAGPKHHVEMVTLLTVIEKYPVIYEKADCLQKFEAWRNVAKELQMDVTDCLLCFRRACQKYCAYKKQDSVSRCNLNQKYYKRFDNIFRSIKPIVRRKINIKTPFELNQSVDDDKTTTNSSDFVFPERYISDISMSNCDSDLVVKNWVYAFGNLPAAVSESTQLRPILKKYVPHLASKAK